MTYRPDSLRQHAARMLEEADQIERGAHCWVCAGADKPPHLLDQKKCARHNDLEERRKHMAQMIPDYMRPSPVQQLDLKPYWDRNGCYVPTDEQMPLPEPPNE